jgi:hypothetical protein
MASMPSVSDPATAAPASPTGTKTRKNQPSAGALGHESCSNERPPDASAPNDPAADATALYTPNPRTRASPLSSVASIDCSSEVNGPDSTTSVDSAPVSAKRINNHAVPDTAKATPTHPRTK